MRTGLPVGECRGLPGVFTDSKAGSPTCRQEPM
jgi:hypothetical protein